MPSTSEHIMAIANHAQPTSEGRVRLDLRLYIGPRSTGVTALEDQGPTARPRTSDTLQSHDVAQLIPNVALVISRVLGTLERNQVTAGS